MIPSRRRTPGAERAGPRVVRKEVVLALRAARPPGPQRAAGGQPVGGHGREQHVGLAAGLQIRAQGPAAEIPAAGERRGELREFLEFGLNKVEPRFGVGAGPREATYPSGARDLERVPALAIGPLDVRPTPRSRLEAPSPAARAIATVPPWRSARLIRRSTTPRSALRRRSTPPRRRPVPQSCATVVGAFRAMSARRPSSIRIRAAMRHASPAHVGRRRSSIAPLHRVPRGVARDAFIKAWADALSAPR